MNMFCAQIKFWQHFKNLKQGGCLPPYSDISGGPKQPPGLISLKCCKNVTGAQNMLIYILGYITYIFVRGVDAPKANLLKLWQTELDVSSEDHLSLLRRGFNTAKIKAREASARFLTQYGVERGGGWYKLYLKIRYKKRHMIQYI